ncbi:hypothetical protein HYC85_018816 [Camellia sinensis]|uniref:Uncharacterized protein n=1 Tax=Camellia sinensis TaxID=4442 RepID=A0A7J7GVE5_CAMSI|nr:hypothetical protein HYC85_018816 [Camellia sinensis]
MVIIRIVDSHLDTINFDFLMHHPPLPTPSHENHPNPSTPLNCHSTLLLSLFLKPTRCKSKPCRVKGKLCTLQQRREVVQGGDKKGLWMGLCGSSDEDLG